MNFEEMQQDLANHLAESKDRDGTWNITEKKRQLNEACLEFVWQTKFNPSPYSMKTVADQGVYDLPKDYLAARQLRVNDLRYRKETMERHFGITGNKWKNGPTTPYNYYVVDDANKQFFLGTTPTQNDLPMVMLYIKSPPILVNNADVSIIPRQYHKGIAAYAAYMMLPKEFENDRRSVAAFRIWKNALRDAREGFHHDADDNAPVAELGPEFRNNVDVLNTGNPEFDNY